MSTDIDLWTYSLRVYGNDDVAASCLWLQDNHAVNVNLLLYGCWLGAHGLKLDSDTLAAAHGAVDSWTIEVVERLRHARRWLKGQLANDATRFPSDLAALRERIKAAELEAERLEQRMLETLPAPARVSGLRVGDFVGVVADNVTRYLNSMGVTIDTDVADRLSVVVAKASGASHATASRELARVIRAPVSRDD